MISGLAASSLDFADLRWIESMVGAEGFEPPTLCSQIVTVGF
jgi:hypothetical protein